MSTLGVNVAVLAALMAVMGIILYAVLAAGWRVIHDDGRLRLAEMLRRQGAAPEQALGVGGYQAAIAVRRCMTCAQKSECNQWLSSGAKRGMEDFCPNAEFVARMSGPHRA
jgi:uncharacterized protein DUF6455